VEDAFLPAMVMIIRAPRATSCSCGWIRFGDSERAHFTAANPGLELGFSAGKGLFA
jgi:hypothetical protein